MIDDSEYLERIVAGIHAVSGDVAEVAWNQNINGRQFDVIVRFNLGTLSYLVLIEVKNRKRKASAEDVDAFVTKARDQNANKAVFVTAAGFQSGAVVVAARHGIDLFTVSFPEDEFELPDAEQLMFIDQGSGLQAPPQLEITGRKLINAFESITLVYKSGTRIEMPSEQSQLEYYLQTTKLKDKSSLNDIIRSTEHPRPELGATERLLIQLPRPQLIQPRDEYFFPSGKIVALDCIVAGRHAYGIRGNVKIPLSMFRSPVVYTNAASGEVFKYSLDELPLGGEEAIAGEFYCIHHPLRYYQCANVCEGEVTWHLIESFQNNQLLSATFSQKAEYAKHYIRVTDRRVLKRLEARLIDYKRRSGKSQKPLGLST
jgi:hypothetical protein